MTCYRKGGCGPYEYRSCYECPASKPEYAERYREYLRPVSTDRLVRCYACGEMFLKTDIDGCHVRCFGLCQRCYDYFDGLQKMIAAFDIEEATDVGDR